MNNMKTRLLTVLVVMCLIMTVEGLTPDTVLAIGQQQMMADVYQPKPYNTTQKCLNGLNRVLFNESSKIPAVIDACGKPGSGFLGGNLAWLGSFELCRDIAGMQYCLVDITVVQTNTTDMAIPMPIRWGLCTIEECTEADIAYSIQEIVNEILDIQWLQVSQSSVHCAKDPPKPYSTGFYIFISICVILCLLMVFGWGLDEFLKRDYTEPLSSLHATKATYSYDENVREDSPLLPSSTPDVAIVKETNSIQLQCKWSEILVEFFLCFALNRNLQTLLNSHQSEKAIRCIHGIRVISMLWVILGHSFLWPAVPMIVDNFVTLFGYLKLFTFQVIVNGTYSVDTFFFLSGLLIGYLVFFELDKTNGQLPWFKYYFHRFWRLTPVLMFTMLFYMYAEPWLGQGPVWYSITNKKMCEDYWWTNILYINNFYPVNNIQGCIPWVWYLANDMQFHWISPLIILPMYKKPWFGIGMLAQFLLASVIVTGVLIGYFDLSGALFTGGAVNLIPTDQPNFFDIVYTKPYCRIAPYLTGMALGFFMQRNKNIQIRNRNLISILGWVAATAIAVSVVYGLYRTSHGYELSTAEEIIYGSLSRFAWSISVAWVVFACHYGMAGLANTILSWPFWIPLSRLTYSAYLFHPIVLDVLVFNFAVPFHYTFNIIVFLFLGVTLMSYGVAALAFLAVELPMANIEKVIEDRINKIKKEK